MITKFEKGIEFLTTEQIKASIESIVRNSSEFLTIICAYLVIPNEHIEYLSKIKQVNLIGGLESTLSGQEAKLKEKIPGVNIKFVKNLHAKCYMNESTILLPSMNLNKYYNPTYDISKDNIEFGLEIHKDEAEELYESIKKEINSIKDFVFENDCSEQKVTSFLKKEEISQNQDMHIRFLKTYGIMSSVKDVITSAKESITIVSPYLDVSEDCLGCLCSTSVRKCLVFGKDDMRKSQKDDFKKVENLNVHYVRQLHAKCYINEDKAVITSMNLLEKSKKNIEIGLEIYRERNPELYKEIKAEVCSIFDDKSCLYDIYRETTDGYCIVCGHSIPFNEKKPFCDACEEYVEREMDKMEGDIECDFELFPEWFAEYFGEPYCHRCGKKYIYRKEYSDGQIGIYHPLCKSCWKIEKLPLKP